MKVDDWFKLQDDINDYKLILIGSKSKDKEHIDNILKEIAQAIDDKWGESFIENEQKVKQWIKKN